MTLMTRLIRNPWHLAVACAPALWLAAAARADQPVPKTCKDIAGLIKQINTLRGEQFKSIADEQRWRQLQAQIDPLKTQVKDIRDGDADGDRCHGETHDHSKKGAGDGHLTCEDIPGLKKGRKTLRALQKKVQQNGYVWQQLEERIEAKGKRIGKIMTEHPICRAHVED